MLNRLLAFSFLMMSLLGGANHAIYISVIELSEERISVKVFSDDLQDAIRNYNDQSVPSSLENFIDLNHVHITSYFNEKLRLTINKKDLRLKLRDFNVEGDASFLFYSFESDVEWKNLSLKADYLMELFPNQSNVLTIKRKNESFFARLTQSNPVYEITFD